MADDEAVALLKWALRTSDDLGVFDAGYGIYGFDNYVFGCFGCANHDGLARGHKDDYNRARFPHAPDCKYVAAMKICGMWKAN